MYRYYIILSSVCGEVAVAAVSGNENKIYKPAPVEPPKICPGHGRIDV